MCNGIIVIDARNGKIIRHFEADDRAEDEKPDPAKFDEALGKVTRSKQDGDETFSDAIKKITERKVGLDDLFKEAKKKAGDKIDEEPRPEDRPDFWD
ncbi:MAG: hypothetical protein KJ645_13905 [Planctomycetes bacterium]|nr:hypothetical protein [Planctomycetota bacterium]